MTRYRPFSNADVRGFLEGKDMFRLPAKPQPEYHHKQIFSDYRQGVHLLQTTRGLIGSFYDSAKGWYEKNVQVKSPYQPGDNIGVRESWIYDSNRGAYYYKNGDEYFPASGVLVKDFIKTEKINNWRSPITMPREAVRIFLKVISVRVERLQDITQDQAKREGVRPMPHRCGGWENPLHNFKDCYKCAFKIEWNKKYGPEGMQFDKNPWVWVIEVKREG